MIREIAKAPEGSLVMAGYVSSMCNLIAAPGSIARNDGPVYLIILNIMDICNILTPKNSRAGEDKKYRLTFDY